MRPNLNPQAHPKARKSHPFETLQLVFTLCNFAGAISV